MAWAGLAGSVLDLGAGGCPDLQVVLGLDLSCWWLLLLLGDEGQPREGRCCCGVVALLGAANGAGWWLQLMLLRLDAHTAMERWGEVGLLLEKRGQGRWFGSGVVKGPLLCCAGGCARAGGDPEEGGCK